jgi:uncharacterized protein YjiK
MGVGRESRQGNSVLTRYGLDAEPTSSWGLPRRLSEISGLTTTPDDRVFAHNDELAIIYQIDLAEEELVKAFAFGDVAASGDFEGIAFIDDRFYLVTSSGRVYEGREGEDDERMLFNTYGTGIGRYCEVEGLTEDRSDRSLLILCKSPRVDALEDHVAIYRWSLDRRAMADDSLLTIPIESIASRLDRKGFHPSGITIHPETGAYVIVAARESAIVEISRDGDVLYVSSLRRGSHRQAEGVSFTSELDLLIADEGGSRRGRLAVYRPGD